MRVAVSKARKHQTALAVDHLGRGAAVRCNLVIRPDGQNLSVTNGQRLRPRLAHVYGVDVGVQ